MKRVNIKAAFVGEPTASQQGLEVEDDDAEAVILRVRGGEVTLVVPGGTVDDALVGNCSVLRGALRLENERVLSFEIHEGATGAFFEDESARLHERREMEAAVGMFSGLSGVSAGRTATARDVMTNQIISLPPDATFKQAVDLLAFHGVSGLLVFEGERLVGVVSEADVIGKEGGNVTDIMTRDVIGVPETMPIEEVATVLNQYRIRRVPVLRGGRVVGLVTRGDLVRWIASR